MSEYKVIKCDISRQEAIIDALTDMGIPIESIEIHEDAVPLRGFEGDMRRQRANIIVRKHDVTRYMGIGAPNDLGFELGQDGKYTAHVSDYDMGWWRRREPRFNQMTAAWQAEREAKRRGYMVKRVEVDGIIKLLATSN